MTPEPQTETLEEIAARDARTFAERWGVTSASAQKDLTDFLLEVLRRERQTAATVLETRANELQVEWDAPPCIANGFIAMTADTPAGYATWWSMNLLRKLATEIKGEAMKPDDKVQCADCQQWIGRDANHTCKQQVKQNRKAIREGR